MPKQKRAKWGHRSRYLFHMDPPTTYSETAIQALAASYGISSPKAVAEMKDRLEGAASIYRTCWQNHDTAPRAHHMKAAISEIESLIDQLRDKLESMDDWTAELFWHGSMEVKGLLWDDNVKKSRFGHTIDRHKISDKETAIYYLNNDSLFEALEILKNYCQNARDQIRKDAGGRDGSEALRMWVLNIQKFWREVLQRPFRIDYHRGKPVSEAARFCVEAFKTIDPDIPARQIITATRKAVKSGRRRAGKNPIPKKG